MLAVGIGLTVGAVALITQASDDLRSVELAEYSAYTQQWEETNRTQFVNSEFVLSNKHGDVKLTPETDVANNNVHDPGLDVPHFDPYDYYLENPMVQLVDDTTFSQEKSTEIYIKASYLSPKGPINSTIGPIVVPVTVANKVHVSTPAPENRCRGQHGVYTGGQWCQVFSRLKAMCVQVKLDPIKGWQMYNAPIDIKGMSRHQRDALSRSSPKNRYGCDPSRGWNPASYTKVRAEFTRHFDADGKPRLASKKHSWGTPTQVQSFTDLKFQLRSAADPYIDAKKLTHNSMNFPLSSHDANILAAIMLFLGVLMSIQPILEIRACCSDPKESRKKYAYQKSGDWEDAQTDLTEDEWSTVVPTAVAPIRSRRSNNFDSADQSSTIVEEVPETLPSARQTEVVFSDLEKTLHEPSAMMHGRSPVEVEMPSSADESDGSTQLRTRANRNSK